MEALGESVLAVVTEFEFCVEDVTLTEAQPTPNPFMAPVHPAFAEGLSKTKIPDKMHAVIRKRFDRFIWCL
jgi:hypothetical protein